MENTAILEEELKDTDAVLEKLIKELDNCNDFQKINSLQLEIIDLKSEINIIKNKLLTLRTINDYCR